MKPLLDLRPKEKPAGVNRRANCTDPDKIRRDQERHLQRASNQSDEAALVAYACRDALRCPHYPDQPSPGRPSLWACWRGVGQRVKKTHRREPTGSFQNAHSALPSGILVPVLTGNAYPCFARRAASIGLVFIRMDVEERGLAQAVFQLVRVYVDHQCDPIPFAPFFLHHVEHEPTGRCPIKRRLAS
jgi:hypothetical protein